MEYYTAGSVAEALKLLQQPGTRIIAGGTDLCVQMEERLIAPEALIDIAFVQELNIMKERKGDLHIGAGVRISAIAESELVPLCLQQGAGAIGSPQIRNLATVGGNICNASPCGDTLSPLVALNADFVLVSPEKERKVQAEDFFIGPKATVLNADEMLREVVIPESSRKGFSAFRMIGKRKGQVISQVNTAVWLSGSADRSSGNAATLLLEDVRIAVGSVAPVPLRLAVTEKLIKNMPKVGITGFSAMKNEITESVTAEIAPIDDVRASKQYRNAVTAALLFDALEEAVKGLLESRV